MNNFQREGSISNAHVGSEFEKYAFEYFKQSNIILEFKYNVLLGVGNLMKNHSFDLGLNIEEGRKILVECKSHNWTKGKQVPSAKLTIWNEAMYYFHLAPKEYQKIFFIKHSYCSKRNESLGEYYIRTNKHLIPDDVEFIEFNEEIKVANTIFKNSSNYTI